MPRPRDSGMGWITANGYRRLRVWSHPWRRPGAQVLEHVLVMELHLGRRLRRDECVHHRDGDKLNNDLANLELRSFPCHNRTHMDEFDRDARGRLLPKKGRAR